MLFGTPFSASASLIIEVLLTAVTIFISTHSEECESKCLSVISKIGVSSYSIYVIHQPIMAFTRYFFTAEIKGVVLVIDLLLTAGLSIMIHSLFEKGVAEIVKRKGWVESSIACVGGCAVAIELGLLVYVNAGVVGDVPE